MFFLAPLLGSVRVLFAHSVIGVSFDIDAVPLGGLRIMFPTPASDATSGVGASYWAASESYPPSPVVPGTNVVLFSDVRSPEAASQPLDTTHIESLLFFSAASIAPSSAFTFCISNVKMLLQ